MKKFFHSALFSMIIVAGLFIGMVKGQESRQRWVSRMKAKHEANKLRHLQDVTLDEIEMSTYHS
jgi:hypothetical protein